MPIFVPGSPRHRRSGLLPTLSFHGRSHVRPDQGCGSSTPSANAPGVTRTRGQQFRKLLLYPSELRGLIPSRNVTCRISFRHFLNRHQGETSPRGAGSVSAAGMLTQWTGLGKAGFRRRAAFSLLLPPEATVGRRELIRGPGFEPEDLSILRSIWLLPHLGESDP